MKRLLLCLMVILRVVTVEAASSHFYSGQTWWSDVRAINLAVDEEFTDFTSLDETFTTPDEEFTDFTSGDEESFTSLDEEFTSPVEIVGEEDEIIGPDEIIGADEEILEEEEPEQLPTGEENNGTDEEIENNGGAEDIESTSVIDTLDEIKESE